MTLIRTCTLVALGIAAQLVTSSTPASAQSGVSIDWTYGGVQAVAQECCGSGALYDLDVSPILGLGSQPQVFATAAVSNSTGSSTASISGRVAGIPGGPSVTFEFSTSAECDHASFSAGGINFPAGVGGPETQFTVAAGSTAQVLIRGQASGSGLPMGAPNFSSAGADLEVGGNLFASITTNPFQGPDSVHARWLVPGPAVGVLDVGAGAEANGAGFSSFSSSATATAWVAPSSQTLAVSGTGAQALDAFGGPGAHGGYRLMLDAVQAGALQCGLDLFHPEDLAQSLPPGEFAALDFPVPTQVFVRWDVSSTASTAGASTLVVDYQPEDLVDGVAEGTLDLVGYDGSAWVRLHGVLDVQANTIEISADLNGPPLIWTLGSFDGTPVAYCTAKLNSQGCLPQIGHVGLMQLGGPAPFSVTAQQVVNGKNGLLFYGTSGAASTAFQGGLLCVAPPVTRTTVQSSAGNAGPDDCSGSFDFDFKALATSGADPLLVVGAMVRAQYWYRDPASGSGSGLTDGLAFEILP